MSGETFDVVADGRAERGAFTEVRRRGMRLEVALLHPVAHRTRLRCALAVGHPDRSVAVDSVDPSLLPEPSVAAAGWTAHLHRGMQVVLPDARLQQAVDATRAALLLAADAPGRPRGEEVAALEDWGFDGEAVAAWRRLGFRERRRAGQRVPVQKPWETVQARLASASATFTWPDGPAPFLRAVRDLLVGPREGGSVALLAELPAGWRGQSLDVRAAPTRAGRVSYAVRWHGPRPALLWECEHPVRLSAPGLDPGWSTTEQRGEALLTAPAEAPHDAGNFT